MAYTFAGGVLRVSILSVGLTLAAPVAYGAAAQELVHAPMACTPAPLLQPGKTQLLERVITRPGARLAPSAGAAGVTVVPGFSVLYVYGTSANGKSVLVGASSKCKPVGWLPEESVVPWAHTMVAAFANRTGRSQILFFRTEANVRALIKSSDAGEEAAKLRARANERASQNDGVVSVEPQTPVDIDKHFYLLPILETKSARFPDGKQVRILHVAAITERATGAAAQADAPEAQASEPGVRHNFRAAIVFAVDATKSTEPFIDRIKAGLDRVYDHIEAAHLQDRVRFGVIGYRDDPAMVPGIGYLTKVFVDPSKVDNRKEFDKLIAGLNASKISTRAVSEDGYAGVYAAIEHIDWSGFSARFVVMETDASSRNPGELGSTGYNATGLSKLAREHQIAILVLHMLTPEGGAADHEKGRREYLELAKYPGSPPLYFPVAHGDPKVLEQTVNLIANRLTELVQSAEEGENPLQQQPPSPKLDGKNTSASDKLGEELDAIGYAMRLAYLGSVNGSTAPSMFDAWASDRDFAHQSIASIDVRVLLTKAQLSDLEATVNALITAFQKGQIDPSSFYAQLRSAALTLSRDPSKIGAASNRELSQKIMGEYLDGLPYTSRVMAITQEDWMAMSPGDQQSLIDDLEVKEHLYREFSDNVSDWVTLAKGASPDDAVYAVPIEALP